MSVPAGEHIVHQCVWRDEHGRCQERFAAPTSDRMIAAALILGDGWWPVVGGFVCPRHHR